MNTYKPDFPLLIYYLVHTLNGGIGDSIKVHGLKTVIKCRRFYILRELIYSTFAAPSKGAQPSQHHDNRRKNTGADVAQGYAKAKNLEFSYDYGWCTMQFRV